MSRSTLMMWQTEAFLEPLRAAHADGRFPDARLSDMVRRILRSMYSVGIDAWGPAREPDMALHHQIALDTSRRGIVLLKNDGVLPLATDTTARIAVIGGFAQLGRARGHRFQRGHTARRLRGRACPSVARASWVPSATCTSIRPRRSRSCGGCCPTRQVEFDPGTTPAEAALLARRSDVVIVFGIRVEGEGFDLPDLSLPWGQDARSKPCRG